MSDLDGVVHHIRDDAAADSEHFDGKTTLSVKDNETVNIPVWAGVGAIVIGGALLLIGGKKG